MPAPNAPRQPGRLADRGMTVAVGLSLAVHAFTFAAITLRSGPTGPTTDVVGDATEMVLGLDLAPPASAPPIAQILPVEPPKPELAPEPIAQTLPTQPPPDEPAAPPTPSPAQPEPVETALAPALEPTPATPATPATTPAPSFAVDVKPGAMPPIPPAPTAANHSPSHSNKPLTTPPRTDPPPPVAAFAGVKAERARSVVYAVDISGVMVGSLPLVFEELERCIARLGPDQQFQVVLFRDPVRAAGDSAPATDEELASLYDRGDWLARSATGPALRPVTDAAKSDLRKLLAAAKSDGASNPLTGLRLALSMKPDVVFLLTRGIRRNATTWGPGETQIMKVLDEANPKDAAGKRATTIRTIQFVAADPSGLLDRIAHEHGGGSCTVLTVAELTKAATPSAKKSSSGARR